MLKRFLSITLGLTLMLMLFVGCQEQTSSTEDPNSSVIQKSGKVVTIAQWNPPTGLFHPHYSTSVYDSNVIGFVTESLVFQNAKGEFYPGLAKEWDFSNKEQTVTFKLKDNVKWHDGEEFTAYDVEYTFKTIGHKDYTGPRYSNFSQILGMQDYHDGLTDEVEGIKVIDKHTIAITTDGIYAPFIPNIGGTSIVPKHIWSEVPVSEIDKRTDLMANFIGTGPFKLTEFVPDQYVALDKNVDYWDGEPKVDTILLKTVNQELAIAHLIKGDIDIIKINDFNPDDMKTFKDNNITVLEGVDMGFQYMGINHEKPYFQDKRVRKALAHALNRQGIVDEILYGKGSVANNPYSPASWACPPLSELKNYEYSKEKSLALFKEAGYEYKDGKLLDKNGKQFELNFIYPSGNIAREKYSLVIDQNLKDIGIKVKLEVMEFKAMQTRCEDSDYDLFALGFTLGADGDHLGIWEYDAPFNFPKYKNEDCINFLKEGLKYSNIEKRKEAYYKWAKFMNEEQPIVWIYNPVLGRAVSPRVKNVQFYNDSIYFDVHKWEIEE